jgi:exonuclease SbcD
MKIIHTADWHIGKQLYNISLAQDFDHFIGYLIDFIKKERVDLLLISGDIFDSSVPGNAARKQYYDTLHQLLQTGVKVVITAGNHDSITQLEAPKEILEHLHVFITGDVKNVKPLLFGEVVVLPVPFLYDRDIRKISEALGENDRVEVVKKGIAEYYSNLSKSVKEEFSDKISIAMGHLFLQGVKESDSERDIQVGKQAAINVQKLEGLFDYIALGHIHNPQKLSEKIRYSGSPVPLSFSEREDAKGFVLLKADDGVLRPEFIKIPKFRDFVRVTGTFTKVQQKLQEINVTDGKLPMLADVVVMEEKEDAGLRLLVNEWLSRFKSDHCQIANYKIIFTNEYQVFQNLASLAHTIEEMNPRSVFIQKLEDETESGDDRVLLLEAFDELYNDFGEISIVTP